MEDSYVSNMLLTIHGTKSTDGARGGIINGATSIPKEIAADQIR